MIREPDRNEHRVFKGPGTNINPHVLPGGSHEVTRILAFRDRLHSHHEERERYERVKRDLAARTWVYVNDYATAKGTVVEEFIARALQR